MTIQVTGLPDAKPKDRHVAIGVFDGVHKGHRAVIDDADTVLTFDPHPLTVIHPEAAPKLIMPADVKRDVIDGLGVEEMVVIPFDREFSKRSAEDFIEKILVEQLGATRVSVGENFRFGAKAKGHPGMLVSHDELETRVVPLVEVDGETVSSSRVRALAFRPPTSSPTIGWSFPATVSMRHLRMGIPPRSTWGFGRPSKPAAGSWSRPS
jgi:riboflavin kinase/FMN adenylyltransferase